MFKEWKREDCQKKWWNGVHQEEENEVDLNLPGRKGSEDWWEKRIDGRRLEWQRQLEEEDTIIVKWTQEDVETMYRLLNNNYKYIYIYSIVLRLWVCTKEGSGNTANGPDSATWGCAETGCSMCAGACREPLSGLYRGFLVATVTALRRTVAKTKRLFRFYLNSNYFVLWLWLSAEPWRVYLRTQVLDALTVSTTSELQFVAQSIGFRHDGI